MNFIILNDLIFTIRIDESYRAANFLSNRMLVFISNLFQVYF